jgi:hypothetical protein
MSLACDLCLVAAHARGAPVARILGKPNWQGRENRR